MQIPKSAIERAKEGGFTIAPHHLREWGGSIPHDLSCQIALDKTFWQALGKSLGWGTQHRQWLKHAHRFYDLILQDQPTDIFWKEILGDNN